MKIVICDDEPYFLEMVSEYCDKFKREYIIPISLIKFTKGEDVLIYYQQDKNVDLFILDIMMEEINGLQLAEEIRKIGIHTQIVFLTAALKYATEGYIYRAARYWLKPLTYEKFSAEMQELYAQIRKECNAYLIENTGIAIEKVYYDEILYIETFNRKTCVHRINSNFISKTNLKEFEKKLDKRFFRCHTAYIVNMDYIYKIKKLEIILSNEKSIYMSKGKKKNFLSALGLYLRDTL
nr:LytTR family DNA-binding domain-containing protein [uncultured Schaedlerella sp.]